MEVRICSPIQESNRKYRLKFVSLQKKYHLNRVILFGSRARGDYWRASDIDLAVSGGDITRFSLDVEEETSTLLTYDVVNLDETVSPELLASDTRVKVI